MNKTVFLLTLYIATIKNIPETKWVAQCFPHTSCIHSTPIGPLSSSLEEIYYYDDPSYLESSYSIESGSIATKMYSEMFYFLTPPPT